MQILLIIYWYSVTRSPCLLSDFSYFLFFYCHSSLRRPLSLSKMCLSCFFSAPFLVSNFFHFLTVGCHRKLCSCHSEIAQSSNRWRGRLSRIFDIRQQTKISFQLHVHFAVMAVTVQRKLWSTINILRGFSRYLFIFLYFLLYISVICVSCTLMLRW